MSCRSRMNTACASLICSMVPVSRTSCVVGPKCRYSPWSPSQIASRARSAPQRVLGAGDFRSDRLEVDIAHLRLAGDLGGGGFRNNTELGLRERERGLVVAPFLESIF